MLQFYWGLEPISAFGLPCACFRWCVSARAFHWASPPCCCLETCDHPSMNESLACWVTRSIPPCPSHQLGTPDTWARSHGSQVDHKRMKRSQWGSLRQPKNPTHKSVKLWNYCCKPLNLENSLSYCISCICVLVVYSHVYFKYMNICSPIVRTFKCYLK